MTQGTDPLLEISALTRRFPRVTALDRVTFALDSGEVVALLGENGAGKSTLVEILAGSLRASTGTMRLGGREFHPRDPRASRAHGVGIVHQHFQLVEAHTVAENLGLYLPDRSLADVVAQWRALAQELAVTLPAPEATVATLGVGERQWLEVGKALLEQPRLLVLDEPSAVLTPVEARSLFGVIARLAAHGTGVLFITHRLDEVAQVASRVVVLRRGATVAQLPADAGSASLAEAMTGVPPSPSPRGQRPPGTLIAQLIKVSQPPRLHPFNLRLHRGEIVVLAGVEGCGMLTAAARLAGLETGPGSVMLDGKDISNHPPSLFRRLGVAVIPGNRTREGIAPTLSVAENLYLGKLQASAARERCTPRVVLSHARKLIEMYAIVATPQQPMHELSGGNQQKVVVARTIAASPRVLVAIHPTRGLDVAAQLAVHDQLEVAAAAGVAILLVTADLDEARALGDRIIVLSRGTVVGEGDRLTPPEILVQWLGGAAA